MPDHAPGARFRLVALDIDGTVLNSAQEVTPELRQTLARLSEASVRIVLCTGRRWRSTVPVLEELGYAHPVVVCCGGALIKRADDERTLCADPIEHAPARLVVRLYRECGLVPLLLYDRPLEGVELKVGRCDRQRAGGLRYLQANPGSFEWYDGEYPDGAERPLEVYTVDRLSVVRPAEARIREGIGELGVVHAMLQLRYGPDQLAVEVHSPTATKWGALRWLLDRWAIDPEEVVAVGDDVNDVPMLEAAGLSFAMGNAAPEVKAAAHSVTSSNDEHGVALALDSVFLR